MSWRDIKTAAREAVHDTFKLPAVYSPPTGDDVECNARLVEKNDLTGDLDREGYGRMLVSVTRIIFDREEFTVLPIRGGTVDFGDAGEYTLESPLPSDGIVTIGFEATRNT